jgi:hypothetical protein
MVNLREISRFKLDVDNGADDLSDLPFIHDEPFLLL